jgi:Leucine-rich repeat (LRR) protein
LYLNNNKLKSFPLPLKGLQELQFLDLKDNFIEQKEVDLLNLNFGFQIRL